MIRTRNQAMIASLETKTNKVGMCQAVTRGWYNAPSVGDVDGDGRSDAEDGWKSEPTDARHVGDRNPPPGVPLYFEGGRNDDGHRAMSHGNGLVRSTDWDTATNRYKPGVTGTAKSIADIERGMGVRYVGWTSTISGHPIPDPYSAKPKYSKNVKAIIEAAKAEKKRLRPDQHVRRDKLDQILRIARSMGRKP